MSEEDEIILGNAHSLFQTKVIEELYEKYMVHAKETPELKLKEVEVAVLSEEDNFKPTKADLDLFNKLRKTLKHEVLRDEVLVDHSCVCAECKHKFPTRREFKKDHPHTTYPLFVRCILKIPNYLNKNKILTLQEAMKDETIFNKKNYQPVCTGCKPSRFARK